MGVRVYVYVDVCNYLTYAGLVIKFYFVNVKKKNKKIKDIRRI